MHCNLKPSEPRQSFPALITTTCKVLSRRTYPLLCLRFLLLIHYIMMWTWPLTLWPSPFTFDLEHVQCIACDMWNPVPNLNAIEQSAAELLRFQCLALWSWIWIKCCARLWDYFHQVWPSTTYPCQNYSVFNADTLCHTVTLTFDLLTLNF